MTLTEAISDVENDQIRDWLKELKYHRESIKNSGDITVRELIFRLLELDIDSPIWLMDSDGFEHQIKINSSGDDYFITGGKGYFNDEN